MKQKLFILMTILIFSAFTNAQEKEDLKAINIVYNKNSTQQDFGVARLSQTLKILGYSPVLLDFSEATGKEEISVTMLPSDKNILNEGFALSNKTSGIELMCD